MGIINWWKSGVIVFALGSVACAKSKNQELPPVLQVPLPPSSQGSAAYLEMIVSVVTTGISGFQKARLTVAPVAGEEVSGDLDPSFSVRAQIVPGEYVFRADLLDDKGQVVPGITCEQKRLTVPVPEGSVTLTCRLGQADGNSSPVAPGEHEEGFTELHEAAELLVARLSPYVATAATGEVKSRLEARLVALEKPPVAADEFRAQLIAACRDLLDGRTALFRHTLGVTQQDPAEIQLDKSLAFSPCFSDSSVARELVR